jgi:4-amino-4-deoxy-L-arabinose transferase-like glycosyltransferase
LLKRLLDGLIIVVLMAYVLIGAPLAPFHGDESTQIFMSRDYAYQFIEDNWTRVRYTDPPISPQEQHLRLLNGTVNKYLIGFAWHLGGFSLADLNQQWDWGADWDYNQSTNHAPSPDLLRTARIPSSLLLALAVPVIFAIGWQLGERPTAYLAAILFALHPALLLNGRRAMMEGSFILFSLCVVAAGIWFIKSSQRRASLVALSVSSGLAIASKHSAVFTVGTIFAGCWLYLYTALMRQPRQLVLTFLRVYVAALLALGVFIALNPAWWNNPFERVGDVLRLRTELLEGQTDAFGGYTQRNEALDGWARFVFDGTPQYFEVAAWSGYIGDQIEAYEASGLAGIAIPPVIMLILTGLGFFSLLRTRRSAAWLVCVWAAAMLASTALLTPLPWQRYYLPTHPAVCLLAAAGISWLFNQVITRLPLPARSSPAPTSS